MPRADIKVGDFVRLVTGSPVMLVLRCYNGFNSSTPYAIDVTWYDQGIKKEEQIDSICFEKCSKPTKEQKNVIQSRYERPWVI
jgi:hypothetical protein